jgi:hypothetical protein
MKSGEFLEWVLNKLSASWGGWEGGSVGWSGGQSLENTRILHTALELVLIIQWGSYVCHGSN